MLNKTDKIYIGFVTCVIIFAVVGVVFVIKSNIQKLGAEKDLILVDIKLNEAKDKILQSKEVDWIIEKEDGTQENNGKIRSYDYITDKKVEDKIKFKPGKSYSNEKIISQVGATTTSALYIGDHFYKDTKGDVYEIEHGATTTIEQWNKQIETKILGASPDSYYTGAGDGAYSFYNSSNNSLWADFLAATPTQTGGINTTYTMCRNRAGTDSRWRQWSRSSFPIDASALPDDADISDASFFVYGSSNTSSYDSLTAHERVLVLCTHIRTNYTSTMIVGDGVLSKYGSTLLASIDPLTDGTNFNVGSYNEFELNSDGIDEISLDGITSLGVIPGGHFYNDEFTYDDDYDQHIFDIYFSEETGTDKDPYLEVTYTAAEAVTARKKANQPGFNLY